MIPAEVCLAYVSGTMHDEVLQHTMCLQVAHNPEHQPQAASALKPSLVLAQWSW
jgi:hypothetical protein